MAKKSYQCAYSSHLWECCAVTLAPGCVRRCRERGARCRGPCTQWSLFLGGHSAAGLLELWRLRRDQSRTWAALSRPAVSQSRTRQYQTTTNNIQFGWARQEFTKNLHKYDLCSEWLLLGGPIECYWKAACIHKLALALDVRCELRNRNRGKKRKSMPSMAAHVPRQSVQQLHMLLNTRVDVPTQVLTWNKLLFHLSKPLHASISISLTSPTTSSLPPSPLHPKTSLN